jgi:plastocyanin
MARSASATALLCVCAWAATGGASRATEVEGGELQGTVTLGPELTPRRVNFPLYADPVRAAQRIAPRSLADEMSRVVVYLEAAPSSSAALVAPAEPYRIAQVGLEFEPHVLAVVRGSTVEFPNRDAVFHNVFSLSKAHSFDLGRYPSGSSRSVRFDTPGIVKVFCHIHSDMSAIIVVLDHPYFATPGRDGRFSIRGIPPGNYRVVPWHERARASARAIRVDVGQVTRADFDIPLDLETTDGG